MAEKSNLVAQLRKEEINRKGRKQEVALGAKKKDGGKSVTRPAAPKGAKPGVPYPIQRGAELICKSGDKYRIEAPIINNRLYVVRSPATQQLYALKIEWLNVEKSHKQMLKEVHILTDVACHEPRFTRHFPRMLFKGRVARGFNWFVFSFVGQNLDDLRATVLKGADFVKQDAGRISQQTFQAVHDLHSMGYLHRDIKPSKFCLGNDDTTVFYMIGFSHSHHFERRYSIKPRGTPRKLPKMTVRTFLPRNYHKNKDIQRRDDLESWLYLSINLFGRRMLPWNEKFSDTNMLVNKDRLYCGGFEEIWKHCPKQYTQIMAALEKQADEKQRPDYTYIGLTLGNIKTELNGLMWHGTGPFYFQMKPGQKPPPPKAEPPMQIQKADPPPPKQAPKEEEDSEEDKAKSPAGELDKERLKREQRKAAEAAAAKTREELDAMRTADAEEAAAALAAARAAAEELKTKLALERAGAVGAELARIQKEKEEMLALLAALKGEQSDAEIEKMRAEKAALAAQFEAMQEADRQKALEAEKAAKAELERKIAEERAKAAALEAQQRADAEKALEEGTQENEPPAEAPEDDGKKFNKSCYIPLATDKHADIDFD